MDEEVVVKSKRGKVARIIRWAVLGASTFFFLFVSRVVSEHAICPIGGFELFFTDLFRSGFTVAGLTSGMVVLFLIMSVASVVFRRLYCGYLCPMGALQELFQALGRKVLPKRIRNLRLPRKVDLVLRGVKYLVLASFVAGAAWIGGHWMIQADPFIAMMTLFKGQGIADLWAFMPGSIVFFAAILVYAFFAGRGFCRYVCPAGAWYALLSKLSPNKVVRNASACNSCGQCSRVCPAQIDVARLHKVTSAECLGCRECVNVCPQNALQAPVGPVGGPTAVVPLAAAALFAGSVALSACSTPQKAGRPGKKAGDTGQGYQKNQGQNGSKPLGLGGCPGCFGCTLCGVFGAPGSDLG